MAIVLATSEGQACGAATAAQFQRAFGRVMSGNPQAGLTYLYMADPAGNELTFTHCGTLRLYLADTQDHSYVLYPDTVEAARSLCQRFFDGDKGWVREQPWSRNAPYSDDEFPVAAPLRWALEAGTMEAPAATAAPAVAPPPLAEKCPRCGGRIQAGYLGMPRFGLLSTNCFPVLWGIGGTQAAYPGEAYRYYARPDEVRPVIALRCESCGHLEFRA